MSHILKRIEVLIVLGLMSVKIVVVTGAIALIAATGFTCRVAAQQSEA